MHTITPPTMPVYTAKTPVKSVMPTPKPESVQPKTLSDFSTLMMRAGM